MITFLRRCLWRLRLLLHQSPAALTLAAVCFLVFWILRVCANTEFVFGYRFDQALYACFGLSWPMLLRGFFWQPLTYIFLHANWLHLGLNMLTVLLFGSGLESEIGQRRFWQIFLIGGVTGGIGWLATTALMAHAPVMTALTHWMPHALRTWINAGSSGTATNALCIGASGGVFALIGAYAALFPQREVYILLLVVPLRLRARTLAWLLGVFTILEAIFVQSQVAYAAHIAGGIGGYLLALRMKREIIDWSRI